MLVHETPGLTSCLEFLILGLCSFHLIPKVFHFYLKKTLRDKKLYCKQSNYLRLVFNKNKRGHFFDIDLTGGTEFFV